jgi:hypothetical protein
MNNYFLNNSNWPPAFPFAVIVGAVLVILNAVPKKSKKGKGENKDDNQQ